jgi:hypothetical protein
MNYKGYKGTDLSGHSIGYCSKEENAMKAWKIRRMELFTHAHFLNFIKSNIF